MEKKLSSLIGMDFYCDIWIIRQEFGVKKHEIEDSSSFLWTFYLLVMMEWFEEYFLHTLGFLVAINDRLNVAVYLGIVTNQVPLFMAVVHLISTGQGIV